MSTKPKTVRIPMPAVKYDLLDLARVDGAEELLRNFGYDYPLAWAITFLSDNWRNLSFILRESNRVDMQKMEAELYRLVYEIRTGKICPDDGGDL